MKKTIKFLISLSAMTSLISCGPTTSEIPEENQLVVTDLLGREVKLSKDDKDHVVCIGAGALRLYSYIGENENLVGVEDIDRDVNKNPFENISRPYYDLNKEFYKTLPSCGKGGPQNQYPEIESIIACNPTLIISEYTDKNQADMLQQKTGIPVVSVSYGNDSVFDTKIKQSIELLGTILDEKEKAEKLNQFISDSKKELKEKAESAAEAPSPLYIGCLGNWGNQDIYSTSSDYILFNVSNIPNALSSDYALVEGKIEAEKFISLNPSKIVLDSGGIGRFKDTYEKNKSIFNSMDAFKNGEIYLQMGYNVYFTNLEIALMDAYFLASIAYPTVYQNFDLEAKYNEISTAFLGVPFYDEICKKPMSYGGFQKIENIEDFFYGK